MTDQVTTRTENDALIERIVKLNGAELLKLDRGTANGTLGLVLPNGKKIQSIKPLLDEYLDAPERRKGTAHLTSLDSFVEHVKRFSDSDSALFGDSNPTRPRLLAVLDYHCKDADGDPRFGIHRSVYEFPVSEEWSTWKAHSGKSMDVPTFAAFLESHILEIAHPLALSKLDAESTPVKVAEALGIAYATPQRLMQLSKGLAIKAEQKITNIANLQSGESEIFFKEEHSDEQGAPLNVPGGFLISIPVFRSGAPWLIAAQLCYRKSPAFSWHYKLYRTDITWDAAIREACDVAEKQTGLPLYMGTPEEA